MAPAVIARWWFPDIDPRRVVWLRRALYAFVILDVVLLTPWVRDHRAVPGELYRPLRLGRLLHLPTPTETLVDVVMAGLLVSCAIALAGKLPRLAGTAAALLYLEWMLIAFSYGKVDHDRFTILVALAVLPTVRAGSREAAGWAIRMVMLAAVATYLLSVYAKHRFGGGLDEWVDSTTLVRAVTRRGTSLADVLAETPAILHVAQYGVVAMELLSPLLLVPGRVGRVMLAVVVAFHAVTYATVTISFLPHVVCLLAFVPLERLRWDRLRARDLGPGKVLVHPDVAR